MMHCAACVQCSFVAVFLRATCSPVCGEMLLTLLTLLTLLILSLVLRQWFLLWQWWPQQLMVVASLVVRQILQRPN